LEPFHAPAGGGDGGGGGGGARARRTSNAPGAAGAGGARVKWLQGPPRVVRVAIRRAPTSNFAALRARARAADAARERTPWRDPAAASVAEAEAQRARWCARPPQRPPQPSHLQDECNLSLFGTSRCAPPC